MTILNLLDCLLIRSQIISDDIEELVDFYSEPDDLFCVSTALEKSLEMDNFLRFSNEFSERIEKFYDLMLKKQTTSLNCSYCEYMKEKILCHFENNDCVEGLYRHLEYEKRKVSVNDTLFNDHFGVTLSKILASDYYALEFLEKASTDIKRENSFLTKEAKENLRENISYDNVTLSMIQIEGYSQEETFKYLGGATFLMSIQYLLSDHKSILSRKPRLLYTLDLFTKWVVNYHRSKIEDGFKNGQVDTLERQLFSYSKMVRGEVVQFVEEEKAKALSNKSRSSILIKKYYPIQKKD